MPHHRHDRRDADAAGNEQKFRNIGREREPVVRRRDRQRVASTDAINQALRAAAARVLALDGDFVTIALERIVGE